MPLSTKEDSNFMDVLILLGQLQNERWETVVDH